jgi:hypothetical protein
MQPFGEGPWGMPMEDPHGSPARPEFPNGINPAHHSAEMYAGQVHADFVMRDQEARRAAQGGSYAPPSSATTVSLEESEAEPQSLKDSAEPRYVESPELQRAKAVALATRKPKRGQQMAPNPKKAAARAKDVRVRSEPRDWSKSYVPWVAGGALVGLVVGLPLIWLLISIL